MGIFLSEPFRVKNKETPGNTGVSLQVGSDYHYPLGTSSEEIVSQILQDKQEVDIVCIHGDIFDTGNGQDSSKEVSEVISLLSEKVKHLIFVPGNHDLRGRDNPFDSFDIPHDVITPFGQFEPREIIIQGIKIVIANLLYDGKFIQTKDEKYTQKEVEKFYKTRLTDGHSLSGDFSQFEKMTIAVRESIASFLPQILITHVPPHPFPVVLMGDIKIDTPGIAITTDKDFISKQAGKKKVSLEDMIYYWNMKTFVMGSNVLDGNNFLDRMVAIYGHNHRGNKVDTIDVGGKEVTFFSGPQPKIV